MRKTLRKKGARKQVVRFDGNELLLLAFMTVVLMGIVAWRMGIVPPVFTSSASVLGVSTLGR